MMKNISAHLNAFASIFVNRSRSFVQTIDDKHFAITITYIGERKIAPEYSFHAASLISASIATGYPGARNIPSSDIDVWHVIVTPFSQLPPLDTEEAAASKAERLAHA